jgi:hypothetical protein
MIIAAGLAAALVVRESKIFLPVIEMTKWSVRQSATMVQEWNPIATSGE